MLMHHASYALLSWLVGFEHRASRLSTRWGKCNNASRSKAFKLEGVLGVPRPVSRPWTIQLDILVSRFSGKNLLVSLLHGIICLQRMHSPDVLGLDHMSDHLSCSTNLGSDFAGVNNVHGDHCQRHEQGIEDEKVPLARDDVARVALSVLDHTDDRSNEDQNAHNIERDHMLLPW